MQNPTVHPIDDSVRKEILARLKCAEEEHTVTIVHAIESGSRAWGFASPDSDYDVRFLNDFIQSELERHGDAFKGQGRPDLLAKDVLREELNGIFRTTLKKLIPVQSSTHLRPTRSAA